MLMMSRTKVSLRVEASSPTEPAKHEHKPGLEPEHKQERLVLSLLQILFRSRLSLVFRRINNT